MIMLALGLGALAGLLWLAQRFARADVRSLKGMLGWIAALGGLSLFAMLLLTGRGALATGALVLLGPAAWDLWRGKAPRAAPGSMRRAEALDVLGLKDPVTDAEIRASWLRLMQAAHPDRGGSDWLAARVNQAKDVLLRRG